MSISSKIDKERSEKTVHTNNGQKMLKLWKLAAKTKMSLTHLAKPSKDADKSSKEDLQQEKLPLSDSVMPRLDEEGSCQEGQVGNLEGA